MGRTTAWCFGTWLKITVLLAGAVLAALLTLGAHHPMFWLITFLAVWLDWRTVRALAREWRLDMEFTWWGRRP